jgi:hypothetical protein
MISDEDIIAMLGARPRWQLVSFAAGCAERLAPVARILGSPEIVAALEAGLTAAWTAAAAGGQADNDTRRTLAAIDVLLKEVEPAFSHLPDYLVLRLLHLVAQPLRAAAGADSVAPASVAADEALEIRSAFDHTLEYPPRSTRQIDPRDPPEPPGPLEAEEVDSQLATLELMSSQDFDRGPAVQAVQRLSAARGRRIAAIMPEIRRRKSWTT